MREVTINGKTFAIQSGVPLPKREKSLGCGRPKSYIRLLVESMKPGDSAFLSATCKRMKQANLSAMGKNTGRKLAYRAEGDGVRLYCLEWLGDGKAGKALHAQPGKS